MWNIVILNDINSGPSIYASLGYDTSVQLIFQSGWVTVGIVGNLVGAACMDWVGRKPLLVLGLGGCCVCLIVEAAMVATFADEGTNSAGLQTGVALLYLFLFLYSIGVDVSTACPVLNHSTDLTVLRWQGLSSTARSFPII